MKRALDRSCGRKELSIEIPSDAIKKIHKMQVDSASDLNPGVDAKDEDSFENIVVRIEYDITGSQDGLQFLNTFSKTDPQMLSVIATLYMNTNLTII